MRDFFEEIVGYEDIKNELRIISDMLNNPDIYKEMGASINNGLVLIGEPGTGKTTMANCLMKSTNRKTYVCRKKASDGEFVKHIAETFEMAKSNSPSIVLLDDLDKFSNEDEDHSDAEEYVTVQSCIDEISFGCVEHKLIILEGHIAHERIKLIARFNYRRCRTVKLLGVGK